MQTWSEFMLGITEKKIISFLIIVVYKFPLRTILVYIEYFERPNCLPLTVAIIDQGRTYRN